MGKKKTGANKGEKCLDAESGLCFGTGEWFILQNNHYHCLYGDQKLGWSHTHTQQYQMEALHPFNFSPAFPFPFFFLLKFTHPSRPSTDPLISLRSQSSLTPSHTPHIMFFNFFFPVALLQQCTLAKRKANMLRDSREI